MVVLTSRQSARCILFRNSMYEVVALVVVVAFFNVRVLGRGHW
jgi:hypothetical protein